VPALLGKGAPRESHFCFVPNYYPKPSTIPSTYVRRGDWKLIRFHGDGENGADRFELYNLAEDIGESNNVAETNPQLVKKLDEEISAYLKRTEAIVPVADSEKNTTSAKPNPVKKRPNPEGLFKRRDSNSDGFVTLQEFIGDPTNRNVLALKRQFKQRDTNKDSRLTLEEMKGQ